jgi:hypothetical protein
MNSPSVNAPAAKAAAREWRGKAAAFAAAVALLLLAAWVLNRRNDPIIDGKPMSEWAMSLVCEHYGRGEYGVKRGYMAIFKRDRDAAIHWLMAAAEYRHSKPRILWLRIISRLPKQLGKRLRPKTTYTSNRWAAVLALSSLSRDQPDARIVPCFLRCMTNDSPAVRKVAAYEAGPWLSPGDLKPIVEILGLALQDTSGAVRRDACRRIAASASGPNSSDYRQATRSLLPLLRGLNPYETRESMEAIRVLDGH